MRDYYMLVYNTRVANGIQSQSGAQIPAIAFVMMVLAVYFLHQNYVCGGPSDCGHDAGLSWRDPDTKSAAGR